MGRASILVAVAERKIRRRFAKSPLRQCRARQTRRQGPGARPRGCGPAFLGGGTTVASLSRGRCASSRRHVHLCHAFCRLYARWLGYHGRQPHRCLLRLAWFPVVSYSSPFQRSKWKRGMVLGAQIEAEGHLRWLRPPRLYRRGWLGRWVEKRVQRRGAWSRQGYKPCLTTAKTRPDNRSIRLWVIANLVPWSRDVPSESAVT